MTGSRLRRQMVRILEQPVIVGKSADEKRQDPRRTAEADRNSGWRVTGVRCQR